MRERELRQMFALEDTYWWFVGRRYLIKRLLRRHLPKRRPLHTADIGCGTGGLWSLLSPLGQAVGLDQAEAAIEYSRSRGWQRLVLGSADRLPFRNGVFDLITALDVLEHVADDKAALCEISRVLRPDGLLLVTVPAYRFLWSEHDQALGHCRRYTARELRARLLQAGLRPVQLSYAITLMFPLVLAYRLFRRLSTWRVARVPQTALVALPAPLNQLLVASLRLEAALLTRLPLPVGVSVVAAARRNNGRQSLTIAPPWRKMC